MEGGSADEEGGGRKSTQYLEEKEWTGHDEGLEIAFSATHPLQPLTPGPLFLGTLSLSTLKPHYISHLKILCWHRTVLLLFLEHAPKSVEDFPESGPSADSRQAWHS